MTPTIYKNEAFCPKCGKPHTYIGDWFEGIENLICQCHKKKKEGFLMGWVCPRCGRGNAPWVRHCNCHQDLTVTIISAGPSDQEISDNLSEYLKKNLK